MSKPKGTTEVMLDSFTKSLKIAANAKVAENNRELRAEVKELKAQLKIASKEENFQDSLIQTNQELSEEYIYLHSYTTEVVEEYESLMSILKWAKDMTLADYLMNQESAFALEDRSYYLRKWKDQYKKLKKRGKRKPRY